VAAVRITSGPLRGVELETAVGGRARRARLLMRAWRRRSASTPSVVRVIPAETLASASEDRAA
jgi:hypothetical protein